MWAKRCLEKIKDREMEKERISAWKKYKIGYYRDRGVELKELRKKKRKEE